jgi:hypothetical protein
MSKNRYINTTIALIDTLSTIDEIYGTSPFQDMKAAPWVFMKDYG